MQKKTKLMLVAGVVGAFLIALAIVLIHRRLKGVNPVKGKITSKYGYRTHPVTGEASTFHNGVDIGVATGTDVKSPWKGKVKSVYSNAVGGNQLIISHDNGYTTGYAHLASSLVQTGESVTAGQVVARSGNTGRTTGPHLHFTLRKNGELMDPEKIFDFKY